MSALRFACFFFIFSSFNSFGSDTLKITLFRADSIFLTNSYYLLAAGMNIEAQKAQIIQAKLYPNPIFTADINAYDFENGKALHVGETGQKFFQFEQLIILGGKRKAEIEMAKTNAAIAELEFQDLTKRLKFQLHSDLFAIGQQEFLLRKYNQQLALLDSLLSAYQVQVDKGNISLRELVRLKGAYLKLNNDRAELFRDYFETQSNLQKILQTSSVVSFEFSEDDIVHYVKAVSLDELKSTAFENHPGLLLTKQDNLWAQQYFRYQKKMAIPDINLFTNYDQRSGAFNNQVNAGISIPLPMWNRNQGNIKATQFRLQETEYQILSLQNEVSSKIQNAYALYNQTVAEYQKAVSMYNQDFDVTIRGMTDNFQKRNVSIIEFIDFFEAYNEVLTELARIKTQLVSSAEELNLLAGRDVY
ncbi:MAG: TolC family protein [Cyclobacteriaceae bacterium]|nr:TolC family protein [Cyclobacteriaceae bacterium]